MKAINERTMVPITWAAAALVTLFGPAVLAAMWVKGVDDRLARIEAHLNISSEAQEASLAPLVGTANAGEHQ